MNKSDTHTLDIENSAGLRFRLAIVNENPLQIAGAINAYNALLAEHAGFHSLYLSGAGVANASFGLPDLGYTSLLDIAEDTRRITEISKLPLLVDADTAWNDPVLTVNTLELSGAAAIHIEDQIDAKRCGHRPGKRLINTDEMSAKISLAVSAKIDTNFVIIARTDAHAVEGFDAAISRSQNYLAAGADMIFAEAFSSLDEYRIFCKEVTAPVLANITEFGKTPLFTVDELQSVGIAMVLYPLSAFRAMSAAALAAYQTIKQTGTQKTLIDHMQTRTELYRFINYEKHEHDADITIDTAGDATKDTTIDSSGKKL